MNLSMVHDDRRSWFGEGGSCVPHRGGSGRVAGTVLLRPIVQSYVMKGCELNKFGTCHVSFRPMNILKIHRKQAKNNFFLSFGYIWAIQVDLTNTESKLPPKNL
jgi:hypothetical protein